MIIQYDRPSIINQYLKQKQFIDAPTRYTAVEATTKAGKTVGCIVWLFEQAISDYEHFYVNENGIVLDESRFRDSKDGCNYWWVAPIFSQAKIAFRRMKRYIEPKELFKANESELTIKLINGATIAFKSAENPDSLYGDDVHAMVIDEASRMKEDSWFACRSTLTATNGMCKIIGNVKGTINWFYQLARKAENGLLKDWSYFKITAQDAIESGVMKAEELEDARLTLPEGIFLELYFGIPFVNSSNKFAYAFNKNKHVKTCSIDYSYPIYLSFDFNKNPISCAVIQDIDNVIKVPLMIKLENSDIYKLCQYITNKIVIIAPSEPHILVCGDASGKNQSAMVKDNLNYFRIIKNELNLPIQRMQQLASNPRIEENQVLVNACLEHLEHEIDPTNASALIFDLEFVEMLPDGTMKKADREDPKQQADALDCLRYWYNRYKRKQFLKGYKNNNNE